MKVYISYGNTADQVTALRLQALAAVNGLTVYVPPAYTRRDKRQFLEAESAQKLKDADVVLGVIRSGLSESCRQELDTSLTLGKATIVMVDPVLAPALTQRFGPNLLVIDPVHPHQTELGLVEHLKSLNAARSVNTSLLALGTLALGLLIFSSAE
ncbi:MAG: hypothetical protein JSU00_16055 [Acidobacteria bacterium]|nr:hypothetical protein [Acidobacteriota bacterium]